MVEEILHHMGRGVLVEPSIAAVCARMQLGGGAAILAEETLTPEATKCLTDAIRQQPSWSDFPLVLLTTSLAFDRPVNWAIASLCSQANVTMLERPVHPVTLVTAVDSAIRARRRQYQVRDYLIEREKGEERVRQSQKMDAVGQLAGGVAHEVNNMMTAVIGFGELVMGRLPPGDPVRADVAEMVKAGERAARITQQLLAFSRKQIRQPKVLDFGRLIRDLSTLLRRLLGADLELRLDLPEGPSSVKADRNQIEQMLVNLTVNARDAMDPGGVFTLNVSHEFLDVAFGREHGLTTFRPGPFLLLRASDNGHGMEDAVRERAFDPFFTTKPVGKGTGLGLSTVYGIVKQSDGFIWLLSEAGHGTTVMVYLPVVQQLRVSEVAEVAPVRHGNEALLVVEDEEVVRRLVKVVLEEHGYTVLEATNGAEALQLLTSGNAQVDALITDTVMPQMNGRELARNVRLRFPDLPVLFMSGYGGDDITDRGLLEPGVPFVQKPFSPDVLAERVRALLDGVYSS